MLDYSKPNHTFHVRYGSSDCQLVRPSRVGFALCLLWTELRLHVCPAHIPPAHCMPSERCSREIVLANSIASPQKARPPGPWVCLWWQCQHPHAALPSPPDSFAAPLLLFSSWLKYFKSSALQELNFKTSEMHKQTRYTRSKDPNQIKHEGKQKRRTQSSYIKENPQAIFI